MYNRETHNTAYTHPSRCQKCGKPFIYVGDPLTDEELHNIICTCSEKDKSSYVQGWYCPKCGRVNAPWVSTCPCGPTTITIHSNTTNITEDEIKKALDK